MINGAITNAHGNLPGLPCSGPECTHFTMFGDRRRWTIDPSKWVHFWSEYCRLAYKGHGNYSLAERPTNVMPIIVDFVFKFQGYIPNDTKESLELLGEDFTLGHCLFIPTSNPGTTSDPDDDLICVVMELEKNWFDRILIY